MVNEFWRGTGQHVQAAYQQALALDLGMPERCALLGMPVDPFLLRVDVNKREHVPAGQQRGAAGQPGQDQPVHLLQLQHVPPGEGPQERPQRGRRSDPAAPTIIPATRHETFTCAFTPHARLIRRCSSVRPSRPACCARAITGTRPARDTRCGSSNVTSIFASSCNNRT